MISQDDIDAFDDFSERFGPAIESGAEAVRRMRKGLPHDRWFDGKMGQALTVQGIFARDVIIGMQTQMLLALMNAERERGVEAMEPTRDPMR